MNILPASPETLKTHFTIEAQKAADFLQRTVESAKQFREYSIKEQLKAGVNLGVLPKGLMKKPNNLTAAFFNNLRLATMVASNGLGFNGDFQKKLSNALKSLYAPAASTSTNLKASASFNTVRVNSKLAELATPHVAKHVERASLLSENFIRNVESEYKVPWNKEYTKLAAEYNSEQITKDELKRLSNNLLLEPHGIRNGLITAGGLNMLADKFNVPVQSKLVWRNTSIAVFNDNAGLQVAKQSTSLKDLPNTLDKLFKNSVGSVANTLTQGLIPQVSLVPIPVAPQGQRFNPRGPSLLG